MNWNSSAIIALAELSRDYQEDGVSFGICEYFYCISPQPQSDVKSLNATRSEQNIYGVQIWLLDEVIRIGSMENRSTKYPCLLRIIWKVEMKKCNFLYS